MANGIRLSKYKLKHLYQNIIRVLGLKGKIAGKLDINVKTLGEYLSLGEIYIEDYEDKISEIFEIETDFIDDKYESSKNEILEQFLKAQGIGALGDKYRHVFDSFFFRMRETEREKYIYYMEQEILNNIKLSENPEEDEKIKLLILFRRIYDRAQLAVDEENCGNIDKHIKSSKNVGLAFKLLEKRNKDDLGEQPKTLTGEVNVNHNIKSFAELANMIQEQQRKMITQQPEQVIDAEYEVKDDIADENN